MSRIDKVMEDTKSVRELSLITDTMTEQDFNRINAILAQHGQKSSFVKKPTGEWIWLLQTPNRFPTPYVDFNDFGKGFEYNMGPSRGAVKVSEGILHAEMAQKASECLQALTKLNRAWVSN